jgi:hypothetical protein
MEVPRPSWNASVGLKSEDSKKNRLVLGDGVLQAAAPGTPTRI